MFCPKCSAEFDDNTKFCPNCGAQVGEKKRALFNLKEKQGFLEVFCYYILMIIGYFIFAALVGFVAALANPAVYNDYNAGYNLGQKMSLITTPLIAIVLSVVFFRAKHLSKNVAAYIFTILGILLPAFIGFIFVACLACLKGKES